MSARLPFVLSLILFSLAACSSNQRGYAYGLAAPAQPPPQSEQNANAVEGETLILEAYESRGTLQVPDHVSELVVNGASILGGGITGRLDKEDYVHLFHSAYISGDVNLAGGNNVLIHAGYNEEDEPYPGGYILGDIITGDGHDTILYVDGEVHGIESGGGADLIIITGGEIAGNVNAGSGYSVPDMNKEHLARAIESESLLFTASGNEGSLLLQVKRLREIEARTDAEMDIVWVHAGTLGGSIIGEGGSQLIIIGDFIPTGKSIYVAGNLRGGDSGDAFYLLSGQVQGSVLGEAGGDLFHLEGGGAIYAEGGPGDDIFHLYDGFRFHGSQLDNCAHETRDPAPVICGSEGEDTLIYEGRGALQPYQTVEGIEHVEVSGAAQALSALPGQMALLAQEVMWQAGNASMVSTQKNIRSAGQGMFAFAPGIHAASRHHYAFHLAHSGIAFAPGENVQTGAGLHRMDGYIASGDARFGIELLGASTGFHYRGEQIRGDFALLGSWLSAASEGAVMHKREDLRGVQFGGAGALAWRYRLGGLTLTPRLATTAQSFYLRHEGGGSPSFSRTPFFLTGEAGMRADYGSHRLEAKWSGQIRTENQDTAWLYGLYRPAPALTLAWQSRFGAPEAGAVSFGGDYHRAINQAHAPGEEIFQARLRFHLIW